MTDGFVLSVWGLSCFECVCPWVSHYLQKLSICHFMRGRMCVCVRANAESAKTLFPAAEIPDQSPDNLLAKQAASVSAGDSGDLLLPSGGPVFILLLVSVSERAALAPVLPSRGRFVPVNDSCLAPSSAPVAFGEPGLRPSHRRGDKRQQQQKYSDARSGNVAKYLEELTAALGVLLRSVSNALLFLPGA